MNDLISPMEYKYILMELKRLESAAPLSPEERESIALLRQMATEYEQRRYDHSAYSHPYQQR